MNTYQWSEVDQNFYTGGPPIAGVPVVSDYIDANMTAVWDF